MRIVLMISSLILLNACGGPVATCSLPDAYRYEYCLNKAIYNEIKRDL